MAADSINYQLRPNKNVQRKLFIEMFRRLDRHLNLEEYRYIGMGGLWFGDFSLVHRELGLTNLVSIESREAARARFNRPFECVHVEEGETTMVLPKLRLGEGKAIIWLDYDSNLMGPVLDDIRILTAEAASLSICMVTVQADIRQVTQQRDVGGAKLSRLEALKMYAGDVLPVGLTEEEISNVRFPGIVSGVLLNAFRHGLRAAGRDGCFQLLLNMFYRDGAPMVTVGGLLCGPGDDAIAISDEHGLPFWPPGHEPYHIQVPLLTAREKAALDQMVPGAGPPTSREVEEELGLQLSDEKLAAYHEFYRQYPIFAEFEA